MGVGLRPLLKEVTGDEESPIASHKRREGRSSYEDHSEVVVSMLGCTARRGALARSHQLTLHVVISVLIGVRHIRRCNLSQSLEVCKVKVKLAAQRGS
jgi:hypothetical protein